MHYPDASVISAFISRASAVFLLAGGIALLFGADDILPRIIPGFPPAGAWLGQLVAAAWLGIAALNWLNRSALLGGIYGRPIVLANTALYFVSAMVLLQAARPPAASRAVAVMIVPFGVFAVAYGWLLFRGPFERDVERRR